MNEVQKTLAQPGPTFAFRTPPTSLSVEQNGKSFASVTSDGVVSINLPGVEAAAVSAENSIKAIAQLLLAARKAGSQ
jgi:hypothetical protein